MPLVWSSSINEFKLTASQWKCVVFFPELYFVVCACLKNCNLIISAKV